MERSSVGSKVLSTAEPEKKPRGRPKTKKPEVEISGIVDIPEEEDNIIEFHYDDVLIIKKVFSVFKAMMAKELVFVFDHETVQIHGRDHRQKSSILVEFDCQSIVHYYCSEKTVVVLQADNVHKIISTMDKSYTMLKMESKRRSIRSKITFTLKNNMNVDELYEVSSMVTNEVITYDNSEFNVDDYVIDLYMGSKYFKKLISIANTFATTMHIRKIRSERLKFLFNDDENMVRAEHTVQDPEKLQLTSMLNDDDIFSISVTIDYIKPVAYSMGLNGTRMYLHESKKIVMTSKLDDDRITIKVATPTLIHQ